MHLFTWKQRVYSLSMGNTGTDTGVDITFQRLMNLLQATE